MATQLVMTVGTNALPVWVAWYHLKDKLKKPIKVRFIYTDDTEPQKKLLESHCHLAVSGNHIKTSPGDPKVVREDIKTRILNGLDEETRHLHVHYTSGTKVMGVETVSAIEKKLSEMTDIRLDTTYLDPRGNSGPCLRSRSKVYENDARRNVKPNLKRIALLNGFVTPPFGKFKELPPPTKEQLAYGKKFLNDPCMAVPSHIAGINKSGDLLEFGAYAEFKDALNDVCTRKNYEIFRNLYVRRTSSPHARPFELDVVAVLGYQIVLVSCGVATGAADIKLKAMEALHRARQLGGDEARAIMLAGAKSGNAKKIEQDLMNDIGSDSLPLRVWGLDKWSNLKNKFTVYLRNDLHWR